jgi:pimeloyl-ACP methyl ester carboxylesterase
MKISLSRLFRCASAFGLFLASGCRDARTPTTAAPDPQPNLTVAADGMLRDQGIDRRDTYLAFNVTTAQNVEGGSSSEMATASIQTANYATDASTYMEAGFGNDGALRFNVYSDGAADARLPAPPPLVRSVGNYVYLYDEWGNVAAAYTFNDFMESVGLPGGDLGTGSPYGNLYNPLGSRGGGSSEDLVEMTGVDPRHTRVRRVRDDVMQVITTSGASTVGAQASTSGAPAVESIRTFRRRTVPTSNNDLAREPGQERLVRPVAHWLLEYAEQSVTQPGKRGTVTVRTVTTYQYVAAHINPGNDERREQALRDRPRPAGPPVPSGAPSRKRSATAAAGEGVTMASIDGINLCETGDVNYTRTVASGGRGVVYQHGFCSDATTWSAMRQRVPETHRVGFEQTYSLNSDAPIENQVTDLAGRLSATGAGGNVVVGHSQGGLVARRLGQRRPDLVSGVVTIGTPHEGALIASRPAAAVADALHDAVDDPCFGYLCTLGFEVAEAIAAGFIARGIGELVPAAGDDQPGSALLQRVNGQSEYQYETFRRASIAMNVNPRWAIFRMIGDGRTSRSRLLTEEPLKGRDYVQDAQLLYDAARVLRYMSVALRWWATAYGSNWGCHQSGYAYVWEPCYNYNYFERWWEVSYWYRVADVMHHIGVAVGSALDWVDRTWDDFTTGRIGGTDGFVQLSSQHYPTYVDGAFPVKRFQINGYEAHSGETASAMVLNRLRVALDEAGVPRN